MFNKLFFKKVIFTNFEWLSNIHGLIQACIVSIQSAYNQSFEVNKLDNPIHINFLFLQIRQTCPNV